MNVYLQTVLFLSLAATAVTALSPPSPGLRRAVSSAIGTVLILSLLLPLFTHGGVQTGGFTLPDLSRAAQTRGSDAYEATLESSVAAGLRQELRAAFSLTEFDVAVSVSGVTVTGVTVTLRGRDRFADADGIVRHVEAGCGVPCRIGYE